MSVTISQFNHVYLIYECPACGKESVYMDDIMCGFCNQVLPDLDRIPEDINERLEIYNDRIGV